MTAAGSSCPRGPVDQLVRQRQPTAWPVARVAEASGQLLAAAFTFLGEMMPRSAADSGRFASPANFADNCAMKEADAAALRLQRSDFAAIREQLPPLHHAILKLLSRQDLFTCGRHLGLLRKKAFVFDNEAESTIFADYQVYSYRPRGFNTAELYLRLNRERLAPLPLALLECMSAALYTIFRIESFEENGVHISDLLLGTRTLLLDRNLARYGVAGQGIAAHLLTFDDFALQSGGMLPVDADLLGNDPASVRICAAMEEDSTRKTDPAMRAKLARAVVAAAIRHGYTRRILYR